MLRILACLLTHTTQLLCFRGYQPEEAVCSDFVWPRQLQVIQPPALTSLVLNVASSLVTKARCCCLCSAFAVMTDTPSQLMAVSLWLLMPAVTIDLRTAMLVSRLACCLL